jgi:hypothetical protein
MSWVSAFFPSDAARQAARFEIAYRHYVETMVAFGRVPASRELVLDEARRSSQSVFDLMLRKRSRLTP